ncbi:hypothetical protein [Smaragdicoccus niigatensis]|uniref:hypothetical protein n=1 Tax=Smaragdicoccus niigatensis TaxID=359359 RepID=UPI00037B57D9|nr:hypothetical protein [Smaragdicoccus niigatensis]
MSGRSHHELRRRAFRDQLDAAESESLELLFGVGELTGADIVTPNQTPAWMRKDLEDAVRGFVDGEWQTCTHNPTPESPQPLFAVAWRRGVIVCRRCEYTLAAKRIENKTCDGCGTYCRGASMTVVSVVKRCITYTAGLCDDCADPKPDGQ